MDLKLAGKTALITGSTAGIGFAIAQALATEGANVIINGRTRERVTAAISRLGRGARGVAADLATADGARKILAAAPDVDILVNNLGFFSALPLAEIEDDDWRGMFDINVVSGARLAQAYLPGMMRRGTGRVIFIGSETGVNVPADMIPYGVSKAAQIALARGLAETTAGSAVTVNSVLPGPTRSEGIGRFLNEVLPQTGDLATAEREFLKKLRPTSLIQRFAEPDEVSALVAFVASPLAAAINGAALRVEGGLLRGIL